MNSAFNFNRWSLYTSKHWNENKKKYLLSLGAIAALLILWYSFVIFIAGDSPVGANIQVLTYYVGLFITGCLFASLLFGDLSDGAKAIHFLLLPVSAFEKLLTAIFFGGILFFISYTIIYYAVDVTMVKWIGSIASQSVYGPDRVFTTKITNVFVASPEYGVNFYIYFLLVYIGVQAAFLLGSVYFVKYNFIKTTVSVLVIFLFFVFFIEKVVHLFMPPGGFFEPFNVYRISIPGREDQAVLLPEWLNYILLFLFKYCTAPVLWVTTYFRLKEKEV